MICPKTKSATHCCLIELFPIYQYKHWTIRRRDDCSVDSSSHRNILKIVGFFVGQTHVRNFQLIDHVTNLIPCNDSNANILGFFLESLGSFYQLLDDANALVRHCHVNEMVQVDSNPSFSHSSSKVLSVKSVNFYSKDLTKLT